jgi:Tfp pilus assembly protein PilF
LSPRLQAALSFVVSIVMCGAISGCATQPGARPTKEEDRVTAILDASAAALSQGDNAGALSYALEAEKLVSERADIEHLKALIYAARGERDTAIEYARRAVTLDPKSSMANNTYGKLLIDDGRGKEGVPFLLQAARDPLNREAYKAWTSLGIYEYHKADYIRATDDLGHAIEASPMNACIAYYYRGHIHLSQGHLKDAIRDYDSSRRKFCADFADGYLALGIAYERDKQYDRARRTFLETRDQFKDGNPTVAEQATNHLKTLP